MGNWVEEYLEKNQELPELPLEFLPAVDKVKVHPGLEMKVASGQYWNNLGDVNREKLLQLVEYLGRDRAGYLESVKSMLPHGGHKPA